ncbi:hypothetical protein [Saccharopolyspora sp. NPDC002686]|uniref:hypothetical protein n=1 Tax=Saccharopolyspora sp. NPDC002686 TaxID=3154541 RepID=UPI00331E5FFD
MNRDSGADQPTQRTVAELLAEYGNSGGQKGSGSSNRRRRRRAEDPSETAPQAIIERVLSDSGQMRAIQPDAEPPQHRSHRVTGRRPATPPPAAQPPAAQPPAAQPPAAQPPAGPPPAAQPPAAQQPPAPPAPPAPEPEQAAPGEADGNQAGGASYWAQRFASAGGKKPAPAPVEKPAPAPAAGDAEATIQQPALRADAPPVPPTVTKKPTPPPEGVTEQLPRVAAPAVAPRPDAEGTEVLAVPPAPVAKPKPEPVEEEPKREDEDPYDFDSFEEPEAEYDEDDYDPELPAGMDADDYRDEDEEDAEPPSPAKEWGTLALQGVAGLVAGGAVWFGFRWLWGFHALAALGAALLFTGLLVLVAWKFLRNNDLQTILLAVLVGLFCTVSPAALLLISH